MLYVLVDEANLPALGDELRNYTLLPPSSSLSSLPTLPPSGHEFNYEAITQRFENRHVARAARWLMHESQLFGSWVGFQPRVYWELFSVAYWRQHDPELAYSGGFAATMCGFQILHRRLHVRITHEGPEAITTIWPTSTFIDLGRVG